MSARNRREKPQVLIVDDQDRYSELVRRAIPEHRYRGPVRSWREAAEALARAPGRVDVVLLDVHFDIPVQDLLGWREGLGDSEVEQLKRTNTNILLSRVEHHMQQPFGMDLLKVITRRLDHVC